MSYHRSSLGVGVRWDNWTNTERALEVLLVQLSVLLGQFSLVEKGCCFNCMSSQNLAYQYSILYYDSKHHSLGRYQNQHLALAWWFLNSLQFVELVAGPEYASSKFHRCHWYCATQVRLCQFCGGYGLVHARHILVLYL